MSYIRGVVTTEDGNLGLLQSVNYNTSVEEATEKDAKGNTALYENFDPKTEASIDAVFNTASTSIPDLTGIDGSVTKNKTLTISSASDSKVNGKYFVSKFECYGRKSGVCQDIYPVKTFPCKQPSGFNSTSGVIMKEDFKDIQNKVEKFDMDSINQAADDIDLDERDMETLSALDSPLIINGVEFSPPTTCFLTILEMIESPFITSEYSKNILAEDVIKLLYFLKFREKSIKAATWLKLERMAEKSPEHYEKYIQNINKVLTLSPFGEEILEFGETLGVFSYLDVAVQIQNYISLCMGGFELLPSDDNSVKKNENSTVNGLLE